MDRNDGIREKLTYLYDFFLERVTLSLNDNGMPPIYATYHRNIIESRPYLDNNANLRYQQTLIVDNIYDDDEFWIMFRRAEFKSRQARGRIKNTLPHMEHLLKAINDFLDN